ncbi:nitroreductase/quinone reductase family protein [Cumulibacter manganitolerans]|uniref:nitroreductase/quinone reductase family protein n=1 Tax=Cumulibacter manganitolerans TaxID=1884992 RepID=UPI001E51A5B5|nr:nitroreductase/quinone reductase family protein [Cumulibacter manganitolerans]
MTASAGPVADRVNAWMDRQLMKRTVRRVVSVIGFRPIVLTTIGRRSGIERAHVVYGVRDADKGWLVVASAGGTATNPAWYHNMAAHPDQVRIDVNGRVIAVTAVQLHGAERAEAWRRFTKKAPWFAGFQKKTDRELPVIRLTPR